MLFLQTNSTTSERTEHKLTLQLPGHLKDTFANQ